MILWGVLAMARVAAAEEDSYLYWMFDNYETRCSFGEARLALVGDDGTAYLSSYTAAEGYTDENGSVSFLDMFTPVAAALMGREYRAIVLELITDGAVSCRSDEIAWTDDLLVSLNEMSVAKLSSLVPLSFTITPEPTGGALVLVGLAALALRRPRGALAALAVFFLGFALAPPLARAAYDDAIVCVATVGPDCYADGSVVRDGERYALVWSADGVFEGIRADGVPVDDKDEILFALPLAQEGRCRLTALPLSRERRARGGVLALWLLDTRVYAADGAVSLAACDAGRPKAVAAASRVTADIAVVPAAATAGLPEAVAPALAPTPVPDDAPRPRIAALRVEEGRVVIAVTNTASYITYQLRSGESPAELRGEDCRVTGGGVMTLECEARGEARFFSVGRSENTRNNRIIE